MSKPVKVVHLEISPCIAPEAAIAAALGMAPKIVPLLLVDCGTMAATMTPPDRIEETVTKMAGVIREAMQNAYAAIEAAPAESTDPADTERAAEFAASVIAMAKGRSEGSEG